MKKLLVFTIAILFSALTLSAQQVKLDVKTGLGDKSRLKVVKAGLIAFLKQSTWAKVVEFGEDYSLWITNYQAVPKGNQMKVDIDLELRSPAMMSKGKLIESIHVSSNLDFTEIRSGKLTFEQEKMFAAVEKQLKTSGNIKELTVGLATTASNAYAPGSGTMGKNFLEFFGADLGGKYSNTDALEGLFVGSAILDTISFKFIKK